MQLKVHSLNFFCKVNAIAGLVAVTDTTCGSQADEAPLRLASSLRNFPFRFKRKGQQIVALGNPSKLSWRSFFFALFGLNYDVCLIAFAV